MHGNESGREVPVIDGRANKGLRGKEAKATMAGLGQETEEVEGCEQGRNLITAS